MPNINEFNWKEMFSNDTGKTSASSFGGIITILCACIGFIIGCITKNDIILNASTTFILSGSALLGVRKFMNNKEDIPQVDNPDNEKASN